jgi:hypothetical protein
MGVTSLQMTSKAIFIASYSQYLMMVDARTFESGETNPRAASVLECWTVMGHEQFINMYVYMYVCMYVCVYVFNYSGGDRFVECMDEWNKNVNRVKIFSLPLDLVAITDRLLYLVNRNFVWWWIKTIQKPTFNISYYF